MFQLHGQELILSNLNNSINEGRFHHAYLLSGASHTGKNTLALQIAQALNCTSSEVPCMQCNQCQRIQKYEHPDVHYITTGGDEGPLHEIGIDAIRELSSLAYLKPFEGIRRVFIIKPAEKLNDHSSNALLKVLEEPPGDVVFILISSSAADLMPTIVSRCQLFQFKKMDRAAVFSILTTNYGIDAENAEIFSRLCDGCIGWAIEASQDSSIYASLHQLLEKIVDTIEGGIESRFHYCEEFGRIYQRDRLSAETHLRLWLSWLRDVMLIQKGVEEYVINIDWKETLSKHAKSLPNDEIVRWIRQIQRTSNLVQRNINPRLALEAVLISSPLTTQHSMQ